MREKVLACRENWMKSVECFSFSPFVSRHFAHLACWNILTTWVISICMNVKTQNIHIGNVQEWMLMTRCKGKEILHVIILGSEKIFKFLMEIFFWKKKNFKNLIKRSRIFEKQRKCHIKLFWAFFAYDWLYIIISHVRIKTFSCCFYALYNSL